MKLLLAILYLLLLALAGMKLLDMLAIRMAGPSDGTTFCVWFLFILTLVSAAAVFHHYQSEGEK